MSTQYKAGSPIDPSEKYVEPGAYHLRVIEARQDTSKAGNDMIEVKLRVIHEDGSYGPNFLDYLVFNQASFWKVDQFLKSCERHPGEGEAIELEPAEMVGWECEATLKVETYEGKKSNKVAAYLWDGEF